MRAETCVKRVHVEACLSGFDRRVNRIGIGHCFGYLRSKPRLAMPTRLKNLLGSREFGFDFQFRIRDTRHVILIRLADYPRRFTRSSGAV